MRIRIIELEDGTYGAYPADKKGCNRRRKPPIKVSKTKGAPFTTWAKKQGHVIVG